MTVSESMEMGRDAERSCTDCLMDEVGDGSWPKPEQADDGSGEREQEKRIYWRRVAIRIWAFLWGTV